MSDSMVHRGVLVPAELRDASIAQLDSYAECVKRDNAAFCRMVWALEDRAGELGLSLEDLEASGRVSSMGEPCDWRTA